MTAVGQQEDQEYLLQCDWQKSRFSDREIQHNTKFVLFRLCRTKNLSLD